jgi:hypothetical protein
MKENKMNHLYTWMWWRKGECVVEVLRTGHFPTTAMVKLPDDRETEVDINELEMPKD